MNLLATLKEQIGQAKYDAIERIAPIFRAQVQLKKSDLKGKIICLWLPLDESVLRKNDLWLVEWENGKTGLVEERDVDILISNNTL